MAVPKEKERLSIYLYPETLEKVKELYRRDDCRTQSQFIEKALRFYITRLVSGENESYLPTAMLSTMKNIVAESENKISQTFFKVAVELAMVHNCFAYSHQDITAENLARLRESVEHEVKCTNGMLTLEEAVEWQKRQRRTTKK